MGLSVSAGDVAEFLSSGSNIRAQEAKSKLKSRTATGKKAKKAKKVTGLSRDYENWVECCKCKKWRRGEGGAGEWDCSMNMDTYGYRSCEDDEEAHDKEAAIHSAVFDRRAQDDGDEEALHSRSSHGDIAAAASGNLSISEQNVKVVLDYARRAPSARECDLSELENKAVAHRDKQQANTANASSSSSSSSSSSTAPCSWAQQSTKKNTGGGK